MPAEPFSPPAIPVHLAQFPTIGALVVPFIALQHRGGGIGLGWQYSSRAVPPRAAREIAPPRVQAGAESGKTGVDLCPRGDLNTQTRSRSVTAVGVPSKRCLAALISALGRPPAQTDDAGGSGRTGVGTRYPP
jgi:hypothetical protein